jgi:histidinol dehydrogenase
MMNDFNNTSKAVSIIDALNSIQKFEHSSKQELDEYWSKKGRGSHSIVLSKQLEQKLIDSIPKEEKEAIDLLCINLNHKNDLFMCNFNNSIEAGDDTKFMVKPIDIVGVYIPKNLPSTAFTFLSSIRAANANKCMVYLAEDELGLPDPLSVYVAHKFNANILYGPARFAFPILALGIEAENIDPVSLICGPCSNSLNILKQVVGLYAQVSVDMWAGSSELAIIIDESADFNQVRKDVLAQLEHGPQSKSHVIIIGKLANQKMLDIYHDLELKQRDAIIIYDHVNSVNDAASLVNKIAPETTEIWTKNPNIFETLLMSSGVVYVRAASSMGDYSVIGRGCADPTGGMAKSQSGLSPMTFLRLQPFVVPNNVCEKISNSGKLIAQYEKLDSHHDAMT